MNDFGGVKSEIWQVIRGINGAWTGGKTENLKRYFQENMVIVSPDLKKMGEGRDACIKSYEDFVSLANVHGCEEFDPSIDVFGNSAVASYRFVVKYDMDGNSHEDAGYDLFFLVREGGKWVAVWRMMIPLPQQDT